MAAIFAALGSESGRTCTNRRYWFKMVQVPYDAMRDKRSRAKLLVLLGIIWVVVTLPLPWVVGNPDIPESQVYTVLGIIGIISIPFVMLAAVWTLRPELAR